ncbi:hypothetical protein NMY22_g18033 [Coprinellus aureogranulatus]|nr:hypothetical protein NMY22_g18033 [Coprinellus aureogranulatus]
MRFSATTFIFGLLALFSTLVAAAPILEKRDVFVPPVIAPAEGAVWPKGTEQVVEWDVSSPPAQITNKQGRIVLRSLATERLLLDEPLAEGFDILEGSQPVTVPTNIPVGQYQIVLFGDSGNWGPTFNIVDAPESS